MRALVADVRELSWRQRVELLRALALDRRISPLAKAAPFALAAYIASPVDLLPDFIPGLGELDDLVLTGFLLRLLQRSVPLALIEEHLARITEREAR